MPWNLDHHPAGRDGPGAASPGRALQGVRDKLDAYYAKQQQQQRLAAGGASCHGWLVVLVEGGVGGVGIWGNPPEHTGAACMHLLMGRLHCRLPAPG